MNIKRLTSSIISTLCLTFAIPMASQAALPVDSTSSFWEQYLTELYENDEGSATALEEAYEHLTELSQQPLDINKVDVSELLNIPGLTIDQISDIIQYREKYGRLRSVDELNMIPSIDDRLKQYLCAFLKVYDDDNNTRWYSKEQLKKEMKYLRHTILLTASVPTYHRAGDKGAPETYDDGTTNKYAGKYLGDPVKHSLRYSLTLGSHMEFNLTGGKSAAEPFFTNGNNLGYDRYAFNLVINRLGIFRKIILGQFRAQFGMGLTLNNNFTLGKQAMLSSIGRLSNTFTPHSSTFDNNHLQGFATTIDIGNTQVSAFFSYRYIDASLNSDSATISSILSSYYHRTANDMRKKNNSSQMTGGVHVSYTRNSGTGINWAVGASFVYTSLNRDMNPTYSKADTVSASKMYRLYYPRGSQFWNGSIDYRMRWRGLTFTGETAISNSTLPTQDNGGKGCAIATINSLSWHASSNLSLFALQRYYSYKYTTLYGSAFSDGGRVQNESGIYVGASWKVLKHLTLDAYTDYAYFPWQKYLVSQPSHCWDNTVSATYELKKWTFALRYRYRLRQRDLTTTVTTEQEDGTTASTKSKSLQDKTDQHLRLIVSYSGSRWTSRTQVEGCFLTFDEDSKGFIASEGLQYKISKMFSAYLFAAYFNTQDYDSRLYAYEKGMQYSFSYSSYYGNGMRLAGLIRADIAKWLTLQAKVGHTRYFDRSTIGTAERLIYANNQTDIDIQARIKL